MIKTSKLTMKQIKYLFDVIILTIIRYDLKVFLNFQTNNLVRLFISNVLFIVLKLM